MKPRSMYTDKFHLLKFSFCPSLLKIVLKTYFCTIMSPQNFSTLYVLQIYVNFYNIIHLWICKLKSFTSIRLVYFHQLIKIKNISKIYYISNFSVNSFVKYGSCRKYKSWVTSWQTVSKRDDKSRWLALNRWCWEMCRTFLCTC